MTVVGPIGSGSGRALPLGPAAAAPAAASEMAPAPPKLWAGTTEAPPRQRLAPWLRVRLPVGDEVATVRNLQTTLRSRNLHTVCEEAHCPNIHECWGGGTATFMVMGAVCTRGCKFCAVQSGRPGPLDPNEPRNVAEAIAEMGLDYVVITSVDRDDLPDQGANHFAAVIREVRRAHPACVVEVLIPDFRGDERLVRIVADAGPDVLAHNVETVRRLQAKARDARATYEQSLRVLDTVRREFPHIHTKSALMLGLGETEEEVLEACRDLRAIDVSVLTLGQYLRPSDWHLPVERFVPPAEFDALRHKAEALGFLYVAAGPFVRSSYRAAEFFMKGVVQRSRRGELVLPRPIEAQLRKKEPLTQEVKA